MGEPLGGARHVRARRVGRERRVRAAEDEVAAHPRGEVEHHVDADARMRSTTSRYSATSRAPLPVSGSRTWMCATAAPARAASRADSAISSGVTGTRSLSPSCRPRRSPRR